MEVVSAPARSASNLCLDCLLGNPELQRDFLLRNTSKFTEHENFTAAGRQGIDGLEQQGGFLAAAGRLDDPRANIYNG